MVTGSSSMTIAERLARFAARASYDDLSEAAREQLKIRVLDALACAIGALDGEPVRLVRAQVEEFDGALALAYQVQCRLSDVAPVRDAGCDHVTQGAYAVAPVARERSGSILRAPPTRSRSLAPRST